VSLESLIPCGEQLLVRRDPPELRCGELVIPETSVLGVTTSGVIVKAGPRAHGFAEGDRVIFGILAGRALAREGVSSEEEYRLLPASDVQCKIGTELTWGLEEILNASS
jgi:NADPH:quinone reductase-like Zn-dependent oxidoreductase